MVSKSSSQKNFEEISCERILEIFKHLTKKGPAVQDKGSVDASLDFDKNFPFSDDALVKGRTCPYFIQGDLKTHLTALKQGSIGKFLNQFAIDKKIEILKNEYLPEDTEGRYFYKRGSSAKGKIEYGDRFNALLLGHEIRHAWQHLTIPKKLFYPKSPLEQIYLDRFIEADARAVEFGLTVQTIHAMRVENKYAANLLACLSEYQKEVLEYSYDKLDRLGRSEKELKQAMREVFDLWIASSPAETSYDNRSLMSLELGTYSKPIKNAFNYFMQGLSFTPKFNRVDIDENYVENLTQKLGDLGKFMKGNYLTETKGPDFNSEFYKRVCNFKLEQAITPYHQLSK